MSATLTVRHILDIPREPNDMIQLTLDYIGNSTIRARLSGNGKQHTLVRPNSTKVNATSFMLSKEPEELAALFDTVGTLANSIDGDWLVEQLKHKLETSDVEDKEAMGARIQRLSAVSSLMVLHAIGNDVMTELLGHNWVAEHSSKLIKRSREWKALVERVTIAQEALKVALPT